MKTPTPAEVAIIKADAAKRFGSDRALLVELDAPIDAAVVMAPFGFQSFVDYVDAEARDTDSAEAAVVVERLLWPSLDEAMALREKWPASASKIVKDLRKAAGDVPGVASAVPLTAATAPKSLGAKGAQDLIEANPKVSLWAVTHVGIELVMKAPLPDVYAAAKAASISAARAKEGLIPSWWRYAKDHILWSAEPIDRLCEARPATIPDLVHPFFAMGGSAATTRATFL